MRWSREPSSLVQKDLEFDLASISSNYCKFDCHHVGIPMTASCHDVSRNRLCHRRYKAEVQQQNWYHVGGSGKLYPNRRSGP